MSKNLLKSAFFEGVGHFEHKFQTKGGVVHQPLLVSESTVIALLYGTKEPQCIIWFCNKTRV